MRLRPIPSTLVLGACALLAAGCGSSVASKNAYINKVNAIQKRLSGVSGAIAATNAKNAGAEAKQLRSLAVQFQQAAGEVSKLTPPSEWKAYHQRLIDGLRTNATGDLQLATAIAGSNAKGVTAATTTLEASQAEIETAINDINKHR